MRSLLTPLMRFGESLLDQTRSADEVADYLARGSQWLMANIMQIEVDHPDWSAQVQLTLALLAELGLLDSAQALVSIRRVDVLPAHSAALAWRDGMAGRMPVSGAGVPEGTSGMLASLLEHDGVAAGDFVVGCVERIMRHVELRRAQAFPPRPGISIEGLWVEKHQAAMLLARASQILGDLRFLNAALKLNDLSYRHHRRFQLDLRHILYLRALAEQELALAKVGA